MEHYSTQHHELSSHGTTLGSKRSQPRKTAHSTTLTKLPAQAPPAWLLRIVHPVGPQPCPSTSLSAPLSLRKIPAELVQLDSRSLDTWSGSSPSLPSPPPALSHQVIFTCLQQESCWITRLSHSPAAPLTNFLSTDQPYCKTIIGVPYFKNK